MRKIIFILTIYLIGLTSMQAQQYSLKQSIDYALANQEALKNLDIDRQLAQKKINEAIHPTPKICTMFR